MGTCKMNFNIKKTTIYLIYLHFFIFLIQIAYGKLIQVENRMEINQYGITWRFDHPVKSGQFINSDWWVVGPVTIVSITPAPGPLTKSEHVNIKVNQWGDTSLRNDARMRNGSMVIRRAGMSQSYDSRGGNFDENGGVKLP